MCFTRYACLSSSSRSFSSFPPPSSPSSAPSSSAVDILRIIALYGSARSRISATGIETSCPSPVADCNRRRTICRLSHRSNLLLDHFEPVSIYSLSLFLSLFRDLRCLLYQLASHFRCCADKHPSSNVAAIKCKFIYYHRYHFVVKIYYNAMTRDVL